MSNVPGQRTLFQAWGASVPPNKVAQPTNDGKKAAGRRRTTPSNNVKVPVAHPPRNPLWAEIGQGSTSTPETFGRTESRQPACEDEDDDLMLVAVYEAEKSLQLDNANFFQDDVPEGAEGTTLSPIPSGGRTYPDFPGFDSSSAKVWIYPTNYPVREYQLKMSEAALFQNTLVCLPTGLGKTFIGSVVMYNFYRWYPSGKIVFMAPTKPLVAQQIEACFKVMGIPQGHMAELTGSIAANQRKEVWRSKRVFFLTPQVMVNDLSRETCPAQQVKCVVIDEAHKALGNHAYCQVIRQLCSQTVQFRILALSATPGGDTRSVQSVISNLLISHIELRSDESPDIQPYSHQRSVEKMVVPLGEVLTAFQARYLQVLEKFMSRLVQNRVMTHKDLRILTKYQLILARDQFRKNPPPFIKGPQQGMLEGDFALCISLYHGYELLMQMGLRSLFFYIQGIMDGSREMSRARNELQKTPNFMDLYHEMEAMFVKSPTGPDEPFIYSHPKLEKLEEVVLHHFRLWAENAAANNGSGHQEVSTRVMIFSSFRESVQEIAAMLNRHAPLIRVMTFMGQASAGKGVKGFTQKEQLEVVHKFRQGGFNTLVSTCVGEEGLDIGEVDLIVCFDAQKNPIRLVQRMGRTGRKRQGRIVVILAEGREERTYNQSQSNKRNVFKSIVGIKNGFHMYPNSPRMLPEEVIPTLHKMYITCGQFDHHDSSRRSFKGRRSRSEGRTSLIHPQNLNCQESAMRSGFLSSSEYSLWASSMKLQEDEAHPTLKQSHFMSLPHDASPQEVMSGSGPPIRELSLWEWRHWQHKVLPTYVVDHSLRCQHFIKVMELIDHMREENEGECQYEQELLPHLNKADTLVHVKNRQTDKILQRKRQKSTKICSKRVSNIPRKSHLFDQEYIDEEVNTDRAGLAPLPAKPKPPVDGEVAYDDNRDRPEPDDVECVNEDFVKGDPPGTQAVDLNTISQLISSIESESALEDVELQAMFYLPKWDLALPSSAKLLQRRDEGLRVILADVAELLSQSPPPLPVDLDTTMADPTPSSFPQQVEEPHQSFHVSFTLDVVDDDDEDDEVIIVDTHASPIVGSESPGEGNSNHDGPDQELEPVSRGSMAADSPTWDEVFGNEEDYCGTLDHRKEPKMYDDFMEAGEEAEKEIEGETEKSRRSDLWNEETTDMKEASMKNNAAPQIDESMDLFGDEETFLQMAIPDIPTPEDDVTPRTSPRPGEIDNTKKAQSPEISCHTALSAHTKQLITQGDKIFIHTAAPHATQKGLPHQSVDSSRDYFPVNFDLGYSLEDSEEEDAVLAPYMSTSLQPKTDSAGSLPGFSSSSTPYNIGHRRTLPLQPSESKSSTPQSLTKNQKRVKSSFLTSPSMSKVGALPSPSARRMLTPDPAWLSRHSPSSLSLKRRRREGCTTSADAKSTAGNESHQEFVLVSNSAFHSAECNTDSEDEVVHKRRHPHKVNPLLSPETAKICSDVDSPLVVNKKCVTALNISDEREDDAISDDDFQNVSVFTLQQRRPERQQVQRGKTKHTIYRKGRQFLDEEAELSEGEGEDLSSDEEDGDDQNQSLEGFVVDNTHFSQGLNDSDMQGVYLKSLKSPAVAGKFKMSYRNHHNIDIFSQVPEMDETYAEDSFVVGSEEEEEELESEEEEEAIELLPEDSYVDGRRQYATRRRVFLHRVKSRADTKAASPLQQRPAVKPKRSRVIRVCDSSEEETEDCGKDRGLITERDVTVPLQPEIAQHEPKPSSSSSIASKISLLSRGKRSSGVSEDKQNERCRQRIENQHQLSNELDFEESESPGSSRKPPHGPPAAPSEPQPLTSVRGDPSAGEPPAPSKPVCILVDSRCLSNGVELMTSLRQRHAVTAQVCSLDGSYFIVSNRMAVERHSQSFVAAMQNRKRLAERVNSLKELFERICFIVEKDRSKPGEASRPFQRARCYDNTLAGLVLTGVRLLWSDGAEESASLLAELARLEQRKGQSITAPLEVKGQHRQQALQLYLSLPSVSYVHALNMIHSFSTVAQLINSSIEAIQTGGCMNRPRAEEIYRFLRYSCDSFFMTGLKAGKTS
ncbi:Fanconi anemia group M protein [Aulostomus maculatus]